MAKSYVVGILKTLRGGGAGSTTPSIKEAKSENLLDDASIEQLRRVIIRPLLEARRKKHQEELRAANMKSWLITVAAYGSVGYIMTSAVRSFAES